MLQNPCRTLGFKKNMVYKISPGGGGEVNHIQPVAYLFVVQYFVSIILLRKRELIDLRYNCLLDVMWMVVFCVIFSRCHGFGLQCVIVTFLGSFTFTTWASTLDFGAQ